MRAAVLSAVSFLFGQPAQAQASLTASFESLDGEPSDIAAQSGIDYQDPTKRAWIAQGRVRAAIRLSDRARMHDEDRTFILPSQLTAQGSPPPGPEPILAVEVNEGRPAGKKYLYTLTEKALYREDIADPSNPTDMVWLPFCPPTEPCNNSPLLEPWEYMTDVEFWNHPAQANRGKVVLLTASMTDLSDALTFVIGD